LPGLETGRFSLIGVSMPHERPIFRTTPRARAAGSLTLFNNLVNLGTPVASPELECCVLKPSPFATVP
jgi:hypothetical protein